MTRLHVVARFRENWTKITESQYPNGHRIRLVCENSYLTKPIHFIVIPGFLFFWWRNLNIPVRPVNTMAADALAPVFTGIQLSKSLPSLRWASTISALLVLRIDRNVIYRKVSNIRRTKSQYLTDSHLVLQSSLPNPLKPGVKLRMKM